MKTVTARKKYTCYVCKAAIPQGYQYAKKSVTIGRPSDNHIRTIQGMPTMVTEGFTANVKTHVQCIG